MSITKYEGYLDQIFIFLFKIIDIEIDRQIFGVSMTLFHYYTYHKHIKSFDRFKLALSCVFLASKIGGNFLKADKIIGIHQSKFSKISSFYEKEITNFELEILNFLGFDMEIETSYSHLENFFRSDVLTSLCKLIYRNNDSKLSYDESRLRNLANNIAHDCYRRPLCIAFQADLIASCCMSLAFFVEMKNCSEAPHSIDLVTIYSYFQSSSKYYSDFQLCFNEIVGLFAKQLTFEIDFN